MEDFSQKLLNLRTGAGYSQEALAEKLNVSRQAVSKWELGTTLPETEKVIAISDFFKVSLDYLLRDQVHTDNNESLDRMVLRFLGAAQDMEIIAEELTDIMQDGIIDEKERKRVESILETLDSIAEIISQMKKKMNFAR